MKKNYMYICNVCDNNIHLSFAFVYNLYILRENRKPVQLRLMTNEQGFDIWKQTENIVYISLYIKNVCHIFVKRPVLLRQCDNEVTEMYSYGVNACVNCKVLPLF